MGPWRLPSARWPLLLLLTSIGFTTLGVFEANRAIRSQRRVAEHALPEYLQWDARCYCHHTMLGPNPVMFFGYVLGSDTLGVARNTHPHPVEGWEVDRPMPVEMKGITRVQYTAAERQWINDTLTKQIRNGKGKENGRFPIVLARYDSMPRLLVYTLMPTTWGDTLVYGAEYARAALTKVLADVMYERRLLPPTFAAGHSIREMAECAEERG